MRPLLICSAVFALAACDASEPRVVELSASGFSKLDGIEAATGIRVDNGAGAVRVEPGGDEPEATLTLYGDATAVRIDLRDDVLVLETRCGPGVCIADYDVRIPQGWSVAVDNGSGSVTVEGLDAAFLALDTGSGGVSVSDVSSGRVELDTGSGGVDVAGLDAGEVHLDTGSGRIDVVGLDADAVLMDTGSGGISALDLRAPVVSADSGSGSVTIEAGVAPEDLRVETGSGGVRVDVPAARYRLELSTGSGGISVDGLEDEPDAERVIDISTGSGGIRLGAF